MTSEELRGKLEKIRDDCVKNTIDRAYATGGTPEFDKMHHGFADSILSLLETAITEAEPKHKTVTVQDLFGGAGDYNNGIKDYKSNLLALVRGEK